MNSIYDNMEIEINLQLSPEYNETDAGKLKCKRILFSNWLPMSLINNDNTEAKRQLEINKLELKISFVLLPEQQTLYEQFSSVFETTQDVFAYFDWPMTIITITLIATNVKDVTRCQEKITKYLSRCINSTKKTYPNGIFQSWNQHIINSFYKYCKDRCILPKLDETERNRINRSSQWYSRD